MNANNTNQNGVIFIPASVSEKKTGFVAKLFKFELEVITSVSNNVVLALCSQ